jgi:nitrite reductase (NADH) small subunit
MTTLLTERWVDVCAASQLVADRGSAALIDGEQVAIYVLSDGQVFALSNHDPWSGAPVMSRGIVGSLGGRLVVASPMYKQHVDLRTGEGVEDPSVSVRTWPARVTSGRVQVACR